MDLFMSGILAFAAVLAGSIISDRRAASRAARGLADGVLFGFLFTFCFLSVAEFAFFDEFDARFNTIAVEYLIYPTEVAGNIWQSYPLLRILAGVLAASGLVFWRLRPVLRRALERPSSPRVRLLVPGLWAALSAGLFAVSGIQTSQVSDNRVAVELAGNGPYSFLYAFWSNDLDYAQYFATVDRGWALSRLKEGLGDKKAEFLDDAENPLDRIIRENGPLRDANFVIVLEESFGANFTGVLGRHPENLTPNFDRLAGEGVLFSRLYATGTRTVRALEAILCGFPPIPGEALVKRPKAGRVFTLADVFKSKGYDTLFVYGGRGLFDGMSGFALKNGFDRFVEQKDYDRPAFTTAWGVSDEDILGKAVDEFDALDRRGRRFFSLVLTVSNHKPYTYPAGRIDLDPNRRRRENAVKYADWAIGDFIRRARERPFFKNTVFAFIGDHGARVYGADFIPINSYRVPLLIYAPDLLKPRRVDTLACSMDVAPTLLGLTDFSYRTVFFGRDILDMDPALGRAFLQHNRDVGLLQGDRLAILGVPKTARLFHFDLDSGLFTPIPHPDEDGEIQLRTAAAAYQTGYELYRKHAWRLPEDGEGRDASSRRSGSP
jgi:phosphoglycerol transferase MdoB-like AlkP superfamily enzyme